jgi:predicted aspartyl protease
MGRENISKMLLLKGELGEARKEVLFDTGSSSSIIKTEIAKRITRLIKLVKPRPFTLGDGRIIESTQYTTIQFELNGKFLSDEFCAIDELPKDIIIGRSAMQRWEMKIDFTKKQIEIGVDPDRMELLYNCA